MQGTGKAKYTHHFQDWDGHGQRSPVHLADVIAGGQGHKGGLSFVGLFEALQAWCVGRRKNTLFRQSPCGRKVL